MNRQEQDESWGSVYSFDSANALDAVPAYKRRTFALLDVRQGDQILDVGCDVGDDVRALARMVGSSGRVVGVDANEDAIVSARHQNQGVSLPIEFHVADAHQLDFPDNTFDGCRSDRTFQHLKDPQKALQELIRVARPGGRIVVCDPDWETLVVDSPGKAITRKLLKFRCDGFTTGWMGRQLPALFRKCGLLDITIVPHTLILTDYNLANQVFFLRKTVDGARAAGVITMLEGAAWLKQIENASRSGHFFSSVTGFLVRGRKP